MRLHFQSGGREQDPLEFVLKFNLKVCKACVLLAGLNKGLPQLGVGKSSKHRSLQFTHMLQPIGLADADAQIEQENTC